VRDVKPHWLTPPGKTKTPDVIFTFDTETTEIDEGDHSVQRLRCWDAKLRRRHMPNDKSDLVKYYRGESAAVFANAVESIAVEHKELWVVAHNLSFDLSITSLPFILSERGWYVDGVHIGDESSWWVLIKDKHRIVITDSWSWVRCSLGTAAKDMKKRKVPLPTDADPLTVWHKRCKRDVDILDELMLTILDWWDQNDLGVFGLTGAACGWRTLRKITPQRRLLVGPEGERTAFERLAIYGGLKEVYGVGEFHDCWIADEDFNGAYVTAAAAFALPLMPAKPWCSPDQLLSTPLPLNRDYIADVVITTHRPCAPVRLGDEVWSPVGQFRTTLAGPDVRYALSVADQVTVLSYRSYKTGFALADWAAWCLKVMNDTTGKTPPIVSRVAKNWGRLTIGRFAARTSRIVGTRPSTHLGWHLETGHDLDTGAVLEWLSMGGVERTIAKDLEGQDCFPAVLAFIESYVRVGLRTVMDHQRPELLLQCNTDGWWHMRANRLRTYEVPFVPWPFSVSRKALERSLLVKGPNHVLSEHERRYAGVPSAALEEGDGHFKYRDWPGLRWQLEHGVTGEYHRPERDSVLAQHYVRRWVLATGETIPVTTGITDDGDTRLLPFCRSWGVLEADFLAPYQVPTLMEINASDRELGGTESEPLPTQPGRGFPILPRGGFLPETIDIPDPIEYDMPHLEIA
jgi:hypothetical protein